MFSYVHVPTSLMLVLILSCKDLGAEDVSCTNVATCYFCNISDVDTTKTVTSDADCLAELNGSSSYEIATFNKYTSVCSLGTDNSDQVKFSYAEHVTYRKTCNTDCPLFSMSKSIWTNILGTAQYEDSDSDTEECIGVCVETPGCRMINYNSGTCKLYTTCGTSCPTVGSSDDTAYTRWCYTAAACGFAPGVSNGYLIYDDKTTQVGAQVSYGCLLNYVPENSNKRTCLSNQSWSTENFTCAPIDCGTPPSITDASAVYSATTDGSTVVYTCNVGYAMYKYGSQYPSLTIECTVWIGVGFWSPSTSSYQCNLVDCGNISDPINGDVIAASTTYGAVATFQCDVGYDLSSDNTLTCEANGNWTDTAPTCVIKNCGSLSAPGNGSISISAQTYLGSASYACITGYDMVGSGTRLCNSSGLWSGSEPSCELVDCGGLSNITDGFVTVSDTTYTSQATYSCVSGYKLSGDATRICEDSGSWNGSQPSCSVIDCGPLTPPTNGTVAAPVTTINQQALYSCDTGFYLDGVSSRTCNSSELWSDTPPTCPPMDCGQPTPPDNGSVTAPFTTYTKEAKFSCDPGYDLIGVQILACNSSGVWNGTAPTCQQINCGSLSTVVNGTVNFTSTTFESQADYYCNTGYELIGNLRRTCNASSKWNGTEPMCSIVDCGPLANPTNGTVSAPITAFSQQALYSCDTGFYLDGVSSRTCNSSELWSDTPPTCPPMDCGQPTPPDNGSVTAPSTTYTKEATFSCDSGYNLIGIQIIACNSSGVWNGTAPTCQQIDCGFLSNIVHGTVNFTSTTFESQADYSCDTGYEIIGNGRRTCNVSSQWNGTQPTCSVVDCGPLANPTNGTVTNVVTTFNGVAIYTCDTGFTRNGTQSRTCGPDGQWSGSAPTCDIIDCGPLEDPTDGAVAFDSTYFVDTAKADYTCNHGYQRSGSKTRSCVVTGSWTGAVPTCTLIDCGSLMSPLNGTVNFTSTLFEATANYTCDAGFELSGANSSLCNSEGDWDPPAPVCTLPDCGPLANQPFGTVSTGNGTTVGETALYDCILGYDLLGTASRVCLVNQSWSDSEPVCDPRDCGPLSAPANGNVSVPGGTTFSEEAYYSCITGNVLNGPTAVSCQASGMWNDTAPSCTYADCGPPTPPTNGLASTSGGTTYNMVAIYTCSSGYERIGLSTRVCQGNEQWSGAVPTCVAEGAVPNIERIFIAPCLCVKNKSFVNMTQEEIISKLIADTAIDLKNTSSARNKLECSGDSRSSSTAIGVLCAGLLSLLGGLIVAVDCIRVCKYVSERRNRHRNYVTPMNSASVAFAWSS